MKDSLDRSLYKAEWRGDEEAEALLDYFLAVGSDVLTVAEETPGNYVVNILDTSAPAQFIVKRYRKGSSRASALTTPPVVSNSDPQAAAVADITPAGFMLAPKIAGRLVLSLLTSTGKAKGKLIVNILQSPPVISNPGTVTPADPVPPVVTDPVPPVVTDPVPPVVTDPVPPVTVPPVVTDPVPPVVTDPVPPVTVPPVVTDPAPPVTVPPVVTDPVPPVTVPPVVTDPVPPAKKPVLGFKVSVGVQPTISAGTDYTLKVRLAVATLTVTAIDDLGVADSDLKFEYSSTGITVAVWTVAPPRSMKLLLLGLGTATLKVTHVPTGAVATLKINIVLL